MAYVARISAIPDSDHPNELLTVVQPIVAGECDLVIGSRTKGKAEPGALLLQARFGNALATLLIRLLYGFSYSDLGPFRAIRFSSLLGLGMIDRTYGWTVEMQIKAMKLSQNSQNAKKRLILWLKKGSC